MNKTIYLGVPEFKNISNISMSDIYMYEGSELKNFDDIFTSAVYEWSLENKPDVIICQNGWKSKTEYLPLVQSVLTGRSSLSVAQHAFYSDLNIPQDAFNKNNLSILDFASCKEYQNFELQEQFKIKLLRELFK